MTLRPRTLVPFVIVVYFLVLIPLVVVIGVSFNPTSSYTFPPAGFSLRWYQAFFATESYVDSFFRVSLTVAFAVRSAQRAMSMATAA